MLEGQNWEQWNWFPAIPSWKLTKLNSKANHVELSWPEMSGSWLAASLDNQSLPDLKQVHVNCKQAICLSPNQSLHQIYSWHVAHPLTGTGRRPHTGKMLYMIAVMVKMCVFVCACDIALIPIPWHIYQPSLCCGHEKASHDELYLSQHCNTLYRPLS